MKNIPWFLGFAITCVIVILGLIQFNQANRVLVLSKENKILRKDNTKLTEERDEWMKISFDLYNLCARQQELQNILVEEFEDTTKENESLNNSLDGILKLDIQNTPLKEF